MTSITCFLNLDYFILAVHEYIQSINNHDKKKVHPELCGFTYPDIK